ncbi:hypothetical protein FB45DRAFT_930410 [Roridomyces roridus]|uniref:Secreted protein n=1 Tax=Roridomyces roridus TaxID=1738132 RepID=A0AAD7BEY1_9AGAR|nr:hypothetical protein FB45DRAFT_930410 [Roridomyces roridus]
MLILRAVLTVLAFALLDLTCTTTIAAPLPPLHRAELDPPPLPWPNVEDLGLMRGVPDPDPNASSSLPAPPAESDLRPRGCRLFLCL